AIADEKRRDERSFWHDFEAKRPGLFGALLDRAVGALKELPNVKLDRLPRMADFARWAVAAELGAGEVPAFLAASTEPRANGPAQALEGALLRPVVLRFCEALTAPR